MFSQNCANGMSWLIRKHALLAEGDAMMCLCIVLILCCAAGGLIEYSKYLAEDFFISTTLWKKYVLLVTTSCW